MKIAVRGNSAPMPVTTSSTSAAPPPTSTVVPAGGASGAVVGAQVADELARDRLVRAVGGDDRERRQVAPRRRREDLGDEPVRRGPSGPVEQLVLLEGQPRIDVDEAVDALDPGVGGEPPRVVVQRREVRRLVAAPGVRIASTIGANGPGPNSPASRSKAARDGAFSGRIRASGALNRTCRNGVPSDEQQGQRRDEHRDRPAHDPPAPAATRRRPRAVAADAPDAQPLEVDADDRERSPAGASSPPATPSATTMAPAMPTERRIMNPNSTSPSSPSSTVSPEKNTARPAVRAVAPDRVLDGVRVASPGPPAPRGSGWSSAASSRRRGRAPAASRG